MFVSLSEVSRATHVPVGYDLGVISVLDLPHRAARTALASGAPVFLAVNPVEYHGPHLPLHTDALISAGIAREMHARLRVHHPEWPFLVATGIEAGVDPCPGPGTRPVPYAAVRAMVIDACRSLVELGARGVVLMTFHGSPLHNLALDAGVRWLAKRGVPAIAPLHLLLRMMLEFDTSKLELQPAFAHVEDDQEKAAMIRDLAIDFHAGFFETSVMLHYAPEHVSADHVRLPPCAPITPNPFFVRVSKLLNAIGARDLARDLGFLAIGLGWYALRPFPGYTGRPHLASPAAGAHFAKMIVDAYVEATEGVLAGKIAAPAPVMPWLRAVSLGGRAGHVHIPLNAIADAA
jgi:creatinine amidohydrolase